YRAVAPWCLPGLQAERDSLDSRESDIGRRHDDAAVDIATLPHHASIARTAHGGLPPAHPGAGRIAYLRRSAPGSGSRASYSMQADTIVVNVAPPSERCFSSFSRIIIL